MRPAGTVAVIARESLEAGHTRRQTEANRVHQKPADHAGAVGDTVGELGRLRVEQDARRFAGARREHEHSTSQPPLLPRALVHVDHVGDLAVSVGYDLPGHRLVENPEPAGLERRKDLHLARRVVGGGSTAPPTLSAVVARRASVQRASQDGASIRDTGNAEPFARRLDQQFVGLGGWWVLEDPVRGAANTFVTAGDADERFSLVVVRRNVVVADRPVRARPSRS